MSARRPVAIGRRVSGRQILQVRRATDPPRLALPPPANVPAPAPPPVNVRGLPIPIPIARIAPAAVGVPQAVPGPVPSPLPASPPPIAHRAIPPRGQKLLFPVARRAVPPARGPPEAPRSPPPPPPILPVPIAPPPIPVPQRAAIVSDPGRRVAPPAAAEEKKLFPFFPRQKSQPINFSLVEYKVMSLRYQKLRIIMRKLREEHVIPAPDQQSIGFNPEFAPIRKALEELKSLLLQHTINARKFLNLVGYPKANEYCKCGEDGCKQSKCPCHVANRWCHPYCHYKQNKNIAKVQCECIKSEAWTLLFQCWSIVYRDSLLAPKYVKRTIDRLGYAPSPHPPISPEIDTEEELTAEMFPAKALFPMSWDVSMDNANTHQVLRLALQLDKFVDGKLSPSLIPKINDNSAAAISACREYKQFLEKALQFHNLWKNAVLVADKCN